LNACRRARKSVERNLQAAAPNRLRVADITYVEPGERGAEAEVDAVPEREVAALAVGVEAIGSS